MMVGDAFSQRYALRHLCFCWVNKHEMMQRTTEEASLAQHPQEVLAEYFLREQEACARGLGLRAAVAARAIGYSRDASRTSSVREKPAKAGGIKKNLPAEAARENLLR